MSQPKCIIVVGASAGGRNALKELLSQLGNDIHAAVFIILHLSNSSLGEYLVHSL